MTEIIPATCALAEFSSKSRTAFLIFVADLELNGCAASQPLIEMQTGAKSGRHVPLRVVLEPRRQLLAMQSCANMHQQNWLRKRTQTRPVSQVQRLVCDRRVNAMSGRTRVVTGTDSGFPLRQTAIATVLTLMTTDVGDGVAVDD
jgi:hypothetical protein